MSNQDRANDWQQLHPARHVNEPRCSSARSSGHKCSNTSMGKAASPLRATFTLQKHVCVEQQEQLRVHAAVVFHTHAQTRHTVVQSVTFVLLRKLKYFIRFFFFYIIQKAYISVSSSFIPLLLPLLYSIIFPKPLSLKYNIFSRRLLFVFFPPRRFRR